MMLYSWYFPPIALSGVVCETPPVDPGGWQKEAATTCNPLAEGSQAWPHVSEARHSFVKSLPAKAQRFRVQSRCNGATDENVLLLGYAAGRKLQRGINFSARTFSLK
jgi:hypothetical protein